jgi:hypothetical protein
MRKSWFMRTQCGKNDVSPRDNPLMLVKSPANYNPQLSPVENARRSAHKKTPCPAEAKQGVLKIPAIPTFAFVALSSARKA